MTLENVKRTVGAHTVLLKCRTPRTTMGNFFSPTWSVVAPVLSEIVDVLPVRILRNRMGGFALSILRIDAPLYYPLR